MMHLGQRSVFFLAVFVLVLGTVPQAGVVAAQDAILLSAEFDTDTGGFAYQDDAFGTSQPEYASGDYLASDGYSAGGLRVLLGGIDSSTITGISGGWATTLNLAAPESGVVLSLRYRLQATAEYQYDEYSRVLVSVDGTLFGRGSQNYIDHVGGDASFAHDTGWLQHDLYLGTLAAGSHALILGGINNKKNASTQTTDLRIDDVLITSGHPAPALSDVQALVGRLDINQFKSNIQSVAGFGDRCRLSGCAPYTSFNNGQQWVAQQLESMGYTTEKHVYATGSNLYATKIGAVHPNQMYIISTHLDGRGGGGAADDDASGVALTLEAARVFAAKDVQTDDSVRFLFFDEEEGGLIGSAAYANARHGLQGQMNPPGSGLYPEPTWLGLIQHDGILYDHGVGTLTTDQSPYADLDVEWRDRTTYASQSKVLAQRWRFLNGAYSTLYPSNSANGSWGTDDSSFHKYCPSISVRENRRGVSEEWINPYYHQITDVYASYSEDDFKLGFNAVQATLGAVAELAGAHVIAGSPYHKYLSLISLAENRGISAGEWINP